MEKFGAGAGGWQRLYLYLKAPKSLGRKKKDGPWHAMPLRRCSGPHSFLLLSQSKLRNTLTVMSQSNQDHLGCSLAGLTVVSAGRALHSKGSDLGVL